jgi:hypothetical protein
MVGVAAMAVTGGWLRFCLQKGEISAIVLRIGYLGIG